MLTACSPRLCTNASTIAALAFHRSPTLVPFAESQGLGFPHPGLLQSPSPAPDTEFQDALSRSDTPLGIVQVQFSKGIGGSVKNLGGMNQTGPACPLPQLRPVGSKAGLSDSGIDSAHSHHFAVHSP